jgi:hypothetical protein
MTTAATGNSSPPKRGRSWDPQPELGRVGLAVLRSPALRCPRKRGHSNDYSRLADAEVLADSGIPGLTLEERAELRAKSLEQYPQLSVAHLRNVRSSVAG